MSREEFAILIPGTSRDEIHIHAAAEEVRQRIEHLALPHPRSQAGDVIPVSVGVAWVEPASGGSPADLVAAADRALYSAKNGGRNRVAEASPRKLTIVLEEGP